VIYLLLAALCFVSSYGDYYIGAEQSQAEKELQATTAAWWAVLAASVGEVNYVVFTAVALMDQDIFRAAAVSFLPTCAGAGLGELRSVRKNFVRDRIRRAAKRAAELAKRAELR